MLLESGGEPDGHSAHRAGDDLRPDRPPAGVRAEPCCGGLPSRAGRSGRARSRRSASAPPLGGRAAGARRARLPRARAALDDPRRGGVPVQARADPRRRLCRPLEVVPRRSPPADGRAGSRAGRPPTSSSRSGPTTSTRLPSSTRSSRGVCRRTSRPRRPPPSSRPGRRALAREANSVARRLFVRAVELEETLERRYLAARAAWRMTDIPTVSAEMLEVSEAAHDAGDRRIEGRALTALARVSLYRDADNECARELATRALAVVELDGRRGPVRRAGGAREPSAGGRVIWTRSSASPPSGSRSPSGSRGPISRAACCSSSTTSTTRASSRSGRTSRWRSRSSSRARAGSPTTRGWTLRAAGRQAALEGRLADAEALARGGTCPLRRERCCTDPGADAELARDRWPGRWRDLERAEEILREAIRILKPIQDRGTVVESQRMLAQVLLEQGRLDAGGAIRPRGA